MKFIFIAVIALCIYGLSSCGLGRYPTSKEFVVYAFDFSKYSDSGFLFTPLILQDRAYQSKGIIRIESWPDVLEQAERSIGVDGKVTTSSTFKAKQVSSEEIIQHAYKYAKGIGANAIIQFDLKQISDTRGNIPDIKGLSLTGFAVKIL